MAHSAVDCNLEVGGSSSRRIREAQFGLGAGKIDHCSEALQAEALAVLKALEFADQAGISRVELEVDSINLKSAPDFHNV
jgi:ribonuclease HI